MATSTVPIALAIMAHPQVREANCASTSLAVFSSDLTRLLWTNTAGAHLLGLDAAGPQSTATQPNTPAIRQIRAARRMLAASDHAEALVRPAGGGPGRPATAKLSLIDGDEWIDDFVLVSVMSVGQDDEAADAASRRLLAETGQRFVALRSPAGDLARDEAAILASETPDPETVDAFRASGQTLRAVAREDGGVTALARLAGDRVLVWTDALPAPNDAAANLAGREGSAEIASTDRSAAPSLDREPSPTPDDEPQGRGGKMGMSALLQRWYFRNRDADAPPGGPDATEAESGVGEARREGIAAASGSSEDGLEDEAGPSRRDHPAAPAGGSTPNRDEPVGPANDPSRDAGIRAATNENTLMPSPGPQQPYDAHVRKAASRRPLRSRWGTPTPVEAGLEVTRPAAPARPVAPDTAPADDPTIGDGQTAPPGQVTDDAGSPPADRTIPVPSDAATKAGSVSGAGEVPEDGGGTDDPPFLPRFDVGAIRFVWRIDSEGRFRSLSPEFAAAVGPRSADVIDRSFRDVATAYDLDADGEVARLLDRRDTWSGRTLYWPVENTPKRVPVDLAALPVYARDRSFDGFRGFGIARLPDAVDDPRAIGLTFGTAAARTAEDALAEFSRNDVIGRSQEIGGRAMLKRFSSDEPEVAFGRRDPADRPAGPAERAAPKIIRLEERRRPKDGELSNEEEAAFRAIGKTLAPEEAPNQLEQAIQTATRRIDELETGRTDDSISGGEDDGKGDPGAAPTEDKPEEDSAAALPARPADNDGGAEDAATDGAGIEPDSSRLLAELDTVYADLPLPVIVQVREDLVYGNRAFFELTGYETVAALADAGGLAQLFADDPETEAEADSLAIRRATGEMTTVRPHMQRSTIAGRSCLVMSFFAAPSVSAAVPQEAAATDQADASAGDRDLEDLRREVEELRAVVDTAADGLVLIDNTGNIRSMNGSAHELFAIPQDDSAGRPFITLFAHESQKATNDYLESLRAGEGPGAIGDGREVIGRVAEGNFVPLLLQFGRLPEGGGWYAVIRDISHRKRAEEELVRARREAEAASLHKSQFLANISHELRTPLNAIIGFADVMATECFGPIGNERYLEYLDDIKRSGHHVLDLVNDLLDISKIEAGKLDLAFEAVSLNEVIADVVALMQPQANRERVIVRSNLPSTVPPVVADNRSIRQIAMNLVANAIRFTPAGGQIIVSTSYSPEGEVALRFRDSGIGMSEREIEIAMMPFRQINPGSRRRGEGTGLGLPLTKALAEANRASFAISSTPGEGTLVEIVFPQQRVLSD